MTRWLTHPVVHMRWLWQQWRMKRRRKKWNMGCTIQDERFIEHLRDAVKKFRFVAPSVGRNDPCPCGSGMKFKKCCINKFKGASQ